MKVLTIQSPYAGTLVSFLSMVKNSEQPAPDELRAGDWVAIYASYRDPGEIFAIAERLGFSQVRLLCSDKPGHIIGAARYLDCVKIEDLDACDDGWSKGPYCWRFSDVVRLLNPIKVDEVGADAHGFWAVDDAEVADLLATVDKISDGLVLAPEPEPEWMDLTKIAPGITIGDPCVARGGFASSARVARMSFALVEDGEERWARCQGQALIRPDRADMYKDWLNLAVIFTSVLAHKSKDKIAGAGQLVPIDQNSAPCPDRSSVDHIVVESITEIPTNFDLWYLLSDDGVSLN